METIITLHVEQLPEGHEPIPVLRGQDVSARSVRCRGQVVHGPFPGNQGTFHG